MAIGSYALAHEQFGALVGNLVMKKLNSLGAMDSFTRDSSFHFYKNPEDQSSMVRVVYQGHYKDFTISEADLKQYDPYGAFGDMVKDAAVWLLLVMEAPKEVKGDVICNTPN